MGVPGFLCTFRTTIFLDVVGPAKASQCVNFNESVYVATFCSFIRPFVILPFVSSTCEINDQPAEVANFTKLVSRPARVNGEVQILNPRGSAIQLLLSRGLVPVDVSKDDRFIYSNAIPPDFPSFSVIARRFFRLIAVVLLMLLHDVGKEGVLIPIIQARVSTHLGTVLLTDVRGLTRGISLSVLPNEILRSVVHVFAKPGTGPVNVFNYGSNAKSANQLGNARPLSTVRNHEVRCDYQDASIPFICVLLGNVSARIGRDSRLPIVPLCLSHAKDRPMKFKNLLSPCECHCDDSSHHWGRVS